MQSKIAENFGRNTPPTGSESSPHHFHRRQAVPVPIFLGRPHWSSQGTSRWPPRAGGTGVANRTSHHPLPSSDAALDDGDGAARHPYLGPGRGAERFQPYPRSLRGGLNSFHPTAHAVGDLLVPLRCWLTEMRWILRPETALRPGKNRPVEKACFPGWPAESNKQPPKYYEHPTPVFLHLRPADSADR